MILTIYFIFFSLAGLGIYYHLFEASNNGNKFQIIDIAKGFILSYALYCLVYTVAFFGLQPSYKILAIIIYAYIAGGTALLCRKILSGLVPDNNLLPICIAIACCVVLPSSLMGNTPFLVSDSWSHLSIMNRLLDEQQLTLSSFSMPNDNYLLKYAPHHTFMAISAYLTHNTALDTFKVARIFLPCILSLSFLSFVNTLDKDFLKRKASVFLAILFFAILFPITDGVWRGSADYRIPSFIIMFELLAVIWGLIELPKKWNPILFIWIALIAYASAITHIFEIAFMCLMILPYGLASAWKEKSKPLLFILLSIIFTLVIYGILAIFIANSADAPLVKGMEYKQFINYYTSQLKTHITYATFFTAAFFTCVLAFENKKIKMFLICALLSSVIFGPLNPLLFTTYDSVMGSSHSNRMMHGFPFYIAIIFSASYLITLLLKEQKRLVKIGSVLGLLAISFSVLQNLYFRGSLNGEFSYKIADSTSQLKIYPNLYNQLKQHSHQIIISDVFTSAPISAVSNNYVFTNRPWTAGGRIEFTKLIMFQMESPEAIQKICQFNISLFLENKNIPPALNKVMNENKWVYSDFYIGQDYKNVSFLDFVGEFDGVNLYSINRKKICANSEFKNET